VVHPNTFQYTVNLKFFLLRNNNILDINTGFLSGMNPTYLDLSRNSIRYVDNSVFRKQGQLETLIQLGNMLQSVESGIFGDCKWTVFELLPAGTPPLPKHLEASRSFVTFLPPPFLKVATADWLKFGWKTRVLLRARFPFTCSIGVALLVCLRSRRIHRL
jgi:hypothetical protein